MDNIKKFEDFLDRMQGLLDNAKRQGHIIVRVEDLENTFPELKESEDEKIRKEIIAFIKKRNRSGCDYDYDKWITWLEKQGQVKDYAISQHENKTCKESDNSLTSEDERIRKVLLNEFIHLQSNGYKFAGLEGEEIITWLEKQKAVEWSEEDGYIIEEIEAIIDAYVLEENNPKALKNWLKSIKPQNRWKPSDEHYELEEFAKIVRGNLTGISEAVQELFEAKYLQLTGNRMYGGFKD